MAQAQLDIAALVRDAGIVGAGGAGFPTHVKLANRVDTVIANGAECEPVLEVDRHLMLTAAPDIVRGLEAVMEHLGAQRGIIAVKVKNRDAIDVMRSAAARNPKLSVEILGDYYPAGDEIILIRQATGRIVTPGELPFTAGVTVSNVATLKQVADALDGRPVTSRLVTVAGEVARPVTVNVPLGTSFAECIAYAGGATVDRAVLILGGPVMGPVADMNGQVTKTTAGIILVPEDHTVAGLRRQSGRVTKQRAKMCCTCQECTILCPRNAVGHPISPAKIMSYAWQVDDIIERIETGDLDPSFEEMIFEALLCCQCGVCEEYACIFGLSPNKVYAMVRDAIKRAGLTFDFSRFRLHDEGVFDYRKLPARLLARKLDVEKYIVHTELHPAGSLVPGRVEIPLCQHIGAPAEPVVREGDRVWRGDPVGGIPEGVTLGANVHASIDGKVVSVDSGHVVIEGSGGV